MLNGWCGEIVWIQHKDIDRILVIINITLYMKLILAKILILIRLWHYRMSNCIVPLWVLPLWAVWTYQALHQHGIHHRGSDAIADYNPTRWDADQMACCPLRDRSPGAVTTQQLIIRWQQWLCPGWAVTWWKRNWLANKQSLVIVITG